MAEPAALNRLVQVRILVPQLPVFQQKEHGIGHVLFLFVHCATCQLGDLAKYGGVPHKT